MIHTKTIAKIIVCHFSACHGIVCPSIYDKQTNKNPAEYKVLHTTHTFIVKREKTQD